MKPEPTQQRQDPNCSACSLLFWFLFSKIHKDNGDKWQMRGKQDKNDYVNNVKKTRQPLIVSLFKWSNHYWGNQLSDSWEIKLYKEWDYLSRRVKRTDQELNHMLNNHLKLTAGLSWTTATTPIMCKIFKGEKKYNQIYCTCFHSEPGNTSTQQDRGSIRSAQPRISVTNPISQEKWESWLQLSLLFLIYGFEWWSEMIFFQHIVMWT